MYRSYEKKKKRYEIYITDENKHSQKLQLTVELFVMQNDI